MIIPLDKLISFDKNKYVFTRAAMVLVDKIANLTEYIDEKDSWKVVPNILKIQLNNIVNYQIDDI